MSETELQDPNSNQIQNELGKEGRKVLGVKLAPLNIPWERRMQTLAVFTWISTFFFMGPAGIFVLIYVFLFTRFGLLSVLYIAWLIYDIDVCNRGGRRWDWVRNWRLWKRYCAYFPISLVKTVDLDPSKNYLFGSHPHGILCSGAFGNFATEGNNVSKVFPGVTMHLLTLEGHYSFPFYREYIMCSGTCSASKSSMNYLLSRPKGGHATVLVVGGAPESLDSHPGSYVLQLKRRKGFIKIALRNGASLVPVFSFGETDIYDQINNPRGSRLRNLQDRFQKVAGLAPAFILGRGLFQYSFGIIPNRKPITTVVGAPIHVEKISEPSQEDIDILHRKYVDALLELFYAHRDKYADANAQLIIS
jgi:hypothetical protein